MDAQKATEVEMKELTSTEVKDSKDAEKSKVEETKEHDNKEEEKEIKKEGNVYSTLTAPTEDVYNVSKPTSTPKGSEAEKEEAKAKGDEKAELNDPPENVDKLTKPTSSPKSNEEAEKKAGGKEKDIKEEETNVYTKLNTPTEDVYNVSKPSSSGSGAEKKAEKDIKEEETDVYSKLITPTEDVYNVSKPSSSSKGEENVKDDEETDLYCKLNTPSENVYMSAVTSSRAKDKEDVNRKLQLYKRISVFFMVLTLILLAVVLALAMKLNESKSIHKCPDSPAEEKKPSYPVIQGNQCSECGKEWYKTNTSCYLLVRKRLTWHASREDCQKKGADLVVINNERLQNFLSNYTRLLYWIGLHYSENKWMWVDNTVPTKSYWAQSQPNPDAQGSCALLKGQSSSNQNWHVNRCNMVSHYICQKRLKVNG